MDLSLFDYHLPDELIAQMPAQKRDESRLLVVERSQATMQDESFCQLANFLQPGDVLVRNDTHVFPARLLGNKHPGGALIEMLLLKPLAEGEWEVIAYRASRLKVGTVVVFSTEFSCEVLKCLPEGKFHVRFSWRGDWNEVLARHGSIPLPPYIARQNGEYRDFDRDRYQTVYAQHRPRYDSAAAPTAGLHFTPELFQELTEKQIQVCNVTLQVGLDTFLPMRVDRVEDHRMHSESYFIPEETANTLLDARRDKRRIIAVGTTSVRVLESCMKEGAISPGPGHTDIFIYPGYPFRVVEGLITNFHLPRSTLLLLVSAFMGSELRQRAYQYAIDNRFRFYSYGDAMLIL